MIEGRAAGLLQGAPAPANAVDVAVRRADVPRFAEWLYWSRARRWNERWQDFGYEDASPLAPGPMRWSIAAGEVRARLVEQLPPAMEVTAFGDSYQVLPLLEVAATDPRAARILERVRAKLTCDAS